MPRFMIPALAFILLVLAGRAGEPAFKPGKLPKGEQDALKPGLVLQFFAKDLSGPVLDARRSRLAAVYVPAEGQPTPWLPSGPFAARWSGYLKVPLRGSFAFQVEGKGKVAVQVNNKEILATELGQGF